MTGGGRQLIVVHSTTQWYSVVVSFFGAHNSVSVFASVFWTSSYIHIDIMILQKSLACFQKQAQKVVDMKGGEKEDLFKRATVNRGNYRRSTKEHHQQLFNSGMLLSLELPLNHFQSGNLLNRVPKQLSPLLLPFFRCTTCFFSKKERRKERTLSKNLHSISKGLNFDAKNSTL